MTSVYVSGLPEDLLGVHVALEEVFGSAGIIKVAISGSFSSSSVNSNGVCFELQTCHEFSTPVRMGFDVHVIFTVSLLLMGVWFAGLYQR